MLKIKLTPLGKKNDRHYRIVVAPQRSKLTGQSIDILGHFHPRAKATDPTRLVVNKEKFAHWLSQGAQPTAKIRRLIKI